MKKTLFVSVLVFSHLLVLAQKHDNIWIMGYYGQNPHPDLGGMMLDFGLEPPLIQDADTRFSFRKTNSSVCNEAGEFLFVTNGAHIFDSSFEIMENGDSLNAFGITFDSYDSGLNSIQGALTIPVPGNDDSFYVYHEPKDWTPDITTHVPMLLYSLVDMQLNNGLGAVVEKNQILIQDTLVSGKLTAVRHGNGRDWWIVTAERGTYTNIFYPVLVSPDSVEVKDKQDAGPGITYSASPIGQAAFSPDGTKYIRHDVRFSPFSAIDIYGFDRCTGIFTHLEHFELEDTTGLTGGVAVSPDSRYLYITTAPRVYQYDLTALDIHATQDTVAEYDGHIGYFFESTFGAAQLAPNGKIYFAAPTQDTVMHIIQTPGQPGLNCNVQQHAVALPNLNKRTIPNMPNYRLGPLDGSPCDTLGLDNHPLAGFAHLAEELTVTFSDNSYYRPELWDWDFGDGQGSTERNPIHEYDEPGEYHVCLTVSNEIDEDTFCRWIEVDTVMAVGTVETVSHGRVSISPNPASNQLRLRAERAFGQNAVLELYDLAGRRVKTWRVPVGQQQSVFWLGDVADGLYFWKLVEDGRQVASGKLMVVQ